MAIAALAVCSCLKDNRLDHNPDDVVAFSEIVLADPATARPEITICSQNYTVGVTKSGRGTSEITAAMGYDSSVLTAINEKEGTSYKALPVEMITIQTDEFRFGKADFVLTCDVRWKYEDVKSLLSSSPADYVIPLVLSSNQEGAVKEGRDVLVIRLVESDLKFMALSGADTDTHAYSPMDPSVAEITEVMLNLSTPNRRDDLEVEVEIAPDLISAYQTATGNYYSAPPEGSAFLYADKVTIGRGEVQAAVRVVIDNSKIEAKHPGYVIPLRIKSVSMPVAVARDVYYITMKPVL